MNIPTTYTRTYVRLSLGESEAAMPITSRSYEATSASLGPWGGVFPPWVHIQQQREGGWLNDKTIYSL